LDSLFKTGKSGAQWNCGIPGTFSGLWLRLSTSLIHTVEINNMKRWKIGNWSGCCSKVARKIK